MTLPSITSTATEAGTSTAPGAPELSPPETGPAWPANERRSTGRNLALGILAGIALVAALYLARAFFIPLLIGILASYALRPVVDWLQARRVPRAAGAALVMAALVGGMVWVGHALSDDTAAMIETLPEAARKLRQTMSESRASGKSPLQNMQEAANEIQGAAAEASLRPGTRPVAARAPESSAWLRDYVLAQSGQLITIAAQTPVVLLLAYFLLASGVHFRRKLVQFVGPTLTHKKEAIHILEEIDLQVQRYLLVTLVSNALVGVATWITFEALGMQHAGVWGVAAGILRFIPYLGSTLIVLGAGIAAFLQFDSVLHAIAIAGAAMLVASSIGFVLMTWVQSRASHVNAAVLFIALLFFGWLWGVAGLLLGAPLLAIVKVICDRVESLKPVGELLGK